MNNRLPAFSLWTAVPGWIIVGAVGILLPLFTLSTCRNIQREYQFTTKLLVEKGAALIRSFEAGARTGMTVWSGFQLQRLLAETAQQPDIVHIIITESDGTVLADNQAGRIGTRYGTDLDLARVSGPPSVSWRQVKSADGTTIFEVYRRFVPSSQRRMGQMRRHMMPPWPVAPEPSGPADQVIFVGLDMGPVEAVRRADMRFSIVIGLSLLAVGFAGIVLLFVTQSYRGALQREMERSRRLASLGLLASGVAHEIRNPLSSIKGFATYFKERFKEAEQDRQTAQIMIQEVDRLDRVVGTLLELAKPMTLNRKQTAVKDLATAALKMVEARAQAAGVTLHGLLEPGLDTIQVDSDRISQVLLNLCLNALDAMDTGGQLTLAIKTAPGQKQQVDISVTDTGKGIDSKDLAHIFDPYFTTKSGGSGLGLAIVHNIVEAHGGQVLVTSTPGQGTTVSIRIPQHIRADDSP